MTYCGRRARPPSINWRKGRVEEGSRAWVKAKDGNQQVRNVAVDFKLTPVANNFSFVNESLGRLLLRRGGIEGRGALRSSALATPTSEGDGSVCAYA
jgi:hypothetical protein